MEEVDEAHCEGSVCIKQFAHKVATTPQDGEGTRKLAHNQLLRQYLLHVLLALHRYALRGLGQQAAADTHTSMYIRNTAQCYAGMHTGVILYRTRLLYCTYVRIESPKEVRKQHYGLSYTPAMPSATPATPPATPATHPTYPISHYKVYPLTTCPFKNMLLQTFQVLCTCDVTITMFTCVHGRTVE